jgi:hypothetical protein
MTNHSHGRLAAGITNEIITIDGHAAQQHCIGVEGIRQGLIAITGHVGDERDAISAADARRLAACWNAFDGVSTDMVETLPGGVPALTKHAGQLHRQLDLMREELGEVLARAEAQMAELAAAKAREAQLVAALRAIVKEHYAEGPGATKAIVAARDLLAASAP